MPAPRVVLDTSVVFPALHFDRGRLVWLREAWQAERIVPVVSSTTADELIKVLADHEVRLTVRSQSELLDAYLPWCEFVDVPDETPAPECRDPSDVPFLQLAAAARADALVTGDKDLLALAPVFAIPILTPAEAHALLLTP